MNPRKKESKKWTTLPPELTKQIQAVFVENFSSDLEGKSLKVEGRVYPTEILLRVGINNKGELRFHNFEVSVDHSQEKQDAVQKINIAVDAIASLVAEYFENDEESELPLTWHEYPFQKTKIWLQYSSTNSDLEAEANKLLGLETDNSMLVEALDALEEMDVQEVDSDEELSEDDDEDDVDTTKPKIFKVSSEDSENVAPKKKKKEEMH